jgi:3D-(3,5/4)-trihydroxycyclohexane-1,2-dione acylhydrolase (decyclizing)
MARMTMAQALVRFLAAQRSLDATGREVSLFGGVFAIFGHGNVSGVGEALAGVAEELPTFRAHNEQAMAHAAIGFAKAHARRRCMAVTTSIGPGATNLVTAAATAHVNRLPLLLLPGDTFGSRRPDPVLQQLEDFGEPGATVNDCLRPVSRLFDRILRAEQILHALPEAMRILTDPAECGPVTLALPQDVQTEALEVPESFLQVRVHGVRRPRPDRAELAVAARAIAAAARPLIVAGGGVHYALAQGELARFAEARGIPVAETQAGKGALVWDHPCAVGAIGVTGTAAANSLAKDADLVLCVGTRLSDFTTASRTLLGKKVALNVQPMDAAKHGALPLVADAREGLAALDEALGAHRAPAEWLERAQRETRAWNEVVDRVTRAPAPGSLPTDAQVLGAVQRESRPGDLVVCAAGGLPGELHKLWRVQAPGGYHVEYGYSCMGYEIAGGLGARMARDAGEVFVLVGDGSYLMMNSEIATSIALGQKLTIVLLDNRAFGCIHRLQLATGGAPRNNLLSETHPAIDFRAHAAALGAEAERVPDVGALEAALARARGHRSTTVIVVETDPSHGTAEGGAWWEVAVPEVSDRAEVRAARAAYENATARRGNRRGDGVE